MPKNQNDNDRGVHTAIWACFSATAMVALTVILLYNPAHTKTSDIIGLACKFLNISYCK